MIFLKTARLTLKYSYNLYFYEKYSQVEKHKAESAAKLVKTNNNENMPVYSLPCGELYNKTQDKNFSTSLWDIWVLYELCVKSLEMSDQQVSEMNLHSWSFFCEAFWFYIFFFRNSFCSTWVRYGHLKSMDSFHIILKSWK